MLSTPIRRLAATAAVTLVALLAGGAGTAFGVIFISVDSPLPGGLSEGDTVPSGRLARGSVDIAFGHVPSDAECVDHFDNLVATVDWGDGAPAEPLTSANIIGDGLDRCTFDLRGPSHRYVLARAEPYVITVSVLHEGDTGSGTRQVRVLDVPFGGRAFAVGATTGQPFTGVVGEIRDENDFSSVGTFSAVVDWGDNTTSPATLVQDRLGRYDVTGTHTYAAPGTYTLLIQTTHAGQTVPLAPGTMTVTGPPAVVAPASLAPATAALRPAFSIRSTGLRLRTLRSRGVLLRIGLGETTPRTLRLTIRGTRNGRVVTLGTTTLRVSRGRIVDRARRILEIRWRPSARLVRRLGLRAGRSYGLRIRVGNTTLQDTFALRR